MRIAVGSDHRGLSYKQHILELLQRMGYETKDFGSYSPEPVDYPDIARAVSDAVVKSRFDYGILICGTGIGMSIAANKVSGIRAALCCDTFSAERARLHNNANILCLGAERGLENTEEILKTFFSTRFEGGRHQGRLEKIRALETTRS